MNNLDTPCFILDLNTLENNVFSFKKALNKYFPNNILGYSVKTNSLPALLEYLNGYGCFAEVVSYDEYNLAIMCGFERPHIIYNGPMKSEQTFIDAIKNNSIVNIETKRELYWLESNVWDQEISVGIRVNVDLLKISPDDTKTGEGFSRFGFSADNGELFDAISRIEKVENVRLKGLHLHRTSKTRSLNVYRNLALFSVELAKKYDLDLDYLDIGGGFYGDMPNKPTYDDYMRQVSDILKSYFDLNKLTLIVEPGNAIIASPVSYLSAVVDVKKIDEHVIVTIDGSRNDIDPLFHKTNYNNELIFNNKLSSSVVPKQTVTGCTCLEFDILFESIDKQQLNVGDEILFYYVGAYTMCLSPLFIRYIPNVYIRKNESYDLVRHKWTELEYVQKSNFKNNRNE